MSLGFVTGRHGCKRTASSWLQLGRTSPCRLLPCSVDANQQHDAFILLQWQPLPSSPSEPQVWSKKDEDISFCSALVGKICWSSKADDSTNPRAHRLHSKIQSFETSVFLYPWNQVMGSGAFLSSNDCGLVKGFQHVCYSLTESPQSSLFQALEHEHLSRFHSDFHHSERTLGSFAETRSLALITSLRFADLATVARSTVSKGHKRQVSRRQYLQSTWMQFLASRSNSILFHLVCESLFLKEMNHFPTSHDLTSLSLLGTRREIVIWLRQSQRPNVSYVCLLRPGTSTLSAASTLKDKNCLFLKSLVSTKHRPKPS